MISQSFPHPVLGEEIAAIGGRYALTKEARMPHRGGEFLYLVGYAVFDTTCCGAGGCAYAFVPGYLVDWKFKTTPGGRPVSEVKPIRDPLIQKEIRQLLQKKETVLQVDFG